MCKSGELVKNYGLSVIIISLIIRLIAFPLTRKTAMQSEIMKKAQPEIEKLEKKYKDKTSEELLELREKIDEWLYNIDKMFIK